MSEQSAAPSRERYSRKRDSIVSAATGILNRRGVKGMTLADVAQSVGLNTTSVTYYFKKKEDLAVACFLRAIERLDAMANDALRLPDPEDRLHAFVAGYFGLNRSIRTGQEAPLAVFNDVRALKEPHHAIVVETYNDLFRKVRSIFAAPGYEWLARKAATARTHMLMEQVFWSGGWLPRYDVEDYPRVTARFFDVLANGISMRAAPWSPESIADGALGRSSNEEFLLAATRLINQRGYRGASVEKIAAQLNVTKGSFYHHNEAKDELVVACFERSFDIMKRGQSCALKLAGSQWDKLVSATVALTDFQVSAHGPLLRASAISALPEPIGQDMLARWNRVSDRFAAMISDGIAEGSIRAVDPVIAAHMLNASLNAAASALTAVRGAEPGEIAELYAKPMLMGLFARWGDVE